MTGKRKREYIIFEVAQMSEVENYRKMFENDDLKKQGIKRLIGLERAQAKQEGIEECIKIIKDVVDEKSYFRIEVLKHLEKLKAKSKERS